MIYIITFCLSVLLILLSENLKLTKYNTENESSNYKYGNYICKLLNIVALLIPIMLATLRNETVGIDVYTYMKPLYLCAIESKGLTDFFSIIKNNSQLVYMDVGYALVAFIACKIFHSLQGLFFVNELLCILPLYFGIKNLNLYLKKISVKYTVPVWLGMLIYYCCFYNNSLNQVRQIIACGILFFAFTLFLNKHYISTFFLFAFSCSLHISSIIFIFILLLYFVSKSKYNLLRIVLAVALIVFLFFSIEIFYLLMKILNYFNLIPDKYYGEIFDVEYGDRDINLSWLFLGIIALFVTGVYYYRNRNNFFARFLFFISLTFNSLFNISSYFISFGRLQLYFLVYFPVILPCAEAALEGIIVEKRLVSNLIIISSVVLFWIVSVYLLDYTGTIPYKFMF